MDPDGDGYASDEDIAKIIEERYDPTRTIFTKDEINQLLEIAESYKKDVEMISDYKANNDLFGFLPYLPYAIWFGPDG